jgi:carbonic anhydrase
MSENNHSCQAFVLACMDFRFHTQLEDQLKARGYKTFDLKCDAGGVKYLISQDKPAVGDWILQNIEISVRLHHIGEVVLINHYDCGAYGGNAAFDSDESQLQYHKEQLSEARELVGAKFPDLKVTTLFATLQDGKVGLVEM